ncbi:Uncharacterised protein [Mycobacterium tuberculosis]|nr:Uncharacterised protein [Mycobacterium tuberculosis]
MIDDSWLQLLQQAGVKQKALHLFALLPQNLCHQVAVDVLCNPHMGNEMLPLRFIQVLQHIPKQNQTGSPAFCFVQDHLHFIYGNVEVKQLSKQALGFFERKSHLLRG